MDILLQIVNELADQIPFVKHILHQIFSLPNHHPFSQTPPANSFQKVP
jgi:hypothetical protein